jgi:hypothetical protein
VYSSASRKRLISSDKSDHRRLFEESELLDLVSLNFRLDDLLLVPEMGKRFDALTEGLCVRRR